MGAFEERIKKWRDDLWEEHLSFVDKIKDQVVSFAVGYSLFDENSEPVHFGGMATSIMEDSILPLQGIIQRRIEIIGPEAAKAELEYVFQRAMFQLDQHGSGKTVMAESPRLPQFLEELLNSKDDEEEDEDE